MKKIYVALLVVALTIGLGRMRIIGMGNQAGPAFPGAPHPIFIMLATRGTSEVASYLNQNPNAVDARDIQQETPLHFAVRRVPEAVPTLLIFRSNKEARNIAGQTPLITAVIDGSPETVKFLIDREANVHAHDNNGNTPLHYLLPTPDSKYDADVKKKAQLLIDAGANLRAMNNQRRTPIDVAPGELNIFLRQRIKPSVKSATK